MKPFIALLLLLPGIVPLHAQNRIIDSLNKLIATAKTDTARINHAVAKVNKLTEINLDEAISFGSGLIREAEQAGYKKGQAEARIQVASGYMRKGIYDSAVQHLQSAQQIASALKDSVLVAKVFGSYGMLYGMQSKYDTSIQYIEKAIGIEMRHGATTKLASRYGNLSIGYQMLSNFTKALYYQQQALRISEAANDLNQQAYTLMNMGNTYLSMGDTLRSEQTMLKAVELAKKQSINNVELYGYSNLASLYDGRPQHGDKSYTYAMKAAELARKLGDDGIEAASLSKAAVALARTGNFAKAEGLSRQAITIADSSAQPYNIFQAYTSMGRVYQLQQKCSDAIPYFTKGLAKLDKADLYDKSIQGIYADLAACYEQTGDAGKALAAIKISAQIKDSINGRDNIRKATELSMNYEFEKKQSLAAALQGKKDAEARSRQTLLIVGLVALLALAIGAWIAFKNKQKAATQLEQTLNKLRETQAQLIQSEKMASLGELTAGIAHEIQNPLNFVNNFSEVSNELVDEMQTALDNGDVGEAKIIAGDISVNLQKIAHHGRRADGIVKGMLQHSRAATGQKEPTDINTLCDEYLRLAYHGLRAKDKSFNATLKTDFDATLGKMMIVPQDMGRVILNLVNNAFYAVVQQAAIAREQGDTNYTPTVQLTTKRSPQRTVITVKDNGSGMPQSVIDKIFQPFFTTKPTGQGTGLGLSLSYDIVKAHGGELKVESEEGKGTVFIISLPA